MTTSPSRLRRYAFLFLKIILLPLAFYAVVYAALQIPATRSILANEALVKTDAGYVQGWRLPERSVFLGLAYAQPPVGDLRFAAPLPAKAWGGTRTALMVGRMCAQAAVPALRLPGSESEDCLTLNVYKPHNTTGKPLPVMVWIHGGGFVTGSGSFSLASDLAVRGQVIVVTMNYRLGPFGFFAHTALAAQDGRAVGNYGLLDQQLAIDWARRNAPAFGGDANNITLFGQSAGGTSVCAHLASPAMKGQFQAAIVQSGLCDDKLAQSMVSALKMGEGIARKLGCTQTSADALAACLRRQSVAAWVATMGEVGVTSAVPYRPVYASAVLPEPPLAAMRAGRFHHVPILIGSTRDEGSLIVAMEENGKIRASQNTLTTADVQQADTLDAYMQRLRDYFPAHYAQVAQRYPFARYGSGTLAYSAVLTDYLFACDADSVRQALLAQGVPVYAYEFADAPSGNLISNDQSGMQLGAYHGADFFYLFYNPLFRQSAAEHALGRDMKDYWSSFAREHQPYLPLGQGGAQWPRFDAQGKVFRLQTTGSMAASDFRSVHQCDYWQSAQAPKWQTLGQEE